MQMTKEAGAAIGKLIRHAQKHPRRWLKVYREHIRPKAMEFELLRYRSNLDNVRIAECGSWGVAYEITIPLADAIAMLRTYPDSVYILDLHPNVVRLMAASGNVQAIFLEGAILAMYDEPIPQP